MKGSAGARHVWEVQRELHRQGAGELHPQRRYQQLGHIQTTNGLVPIATPIESNVYAGSASFEKQQGRLFYGCRATFRIPIT